MDVPFCLLEHKFEAKRFESERVRKQDSGKGVENV